MIESSAVFPAAECQATDAVRARCRLPLVTQTATLPAGREPASSLEGNGGGEGTLAVAVAANPKPDSLRNIRLVVSCDMAGPQPSQIYTDRLSLFPNPLITRTLCPRASD